MRPRVYAAALVAAWLLVIAAPAAATTRSVVTFGAGPGLSASANRLAFQATVDASSNGDTVYVPDGDYSIDVTSLHGVLLNKQVTFQCQSTSAKLIVDANLVDDIGTTWRILEVTASNVTIDGCTLSGNKPSPGTFTDYDSNYEHHHGIFAGPDISNFTLRNSILTDFQGDGLQVYTGVASPLVEGNTFLYGQRSGMSFTPTDPARPVTNGIVRNNTFTGIAGQSIDNEHGAVITADIYGNTFNVLINNYALTISGYTDGIGSANRSKHWHVHGNYFTAGIFVIRAEDVLIDGNTFVIPYTKPCVDISRSASDITIDGNTCSMNQSTTVSIPAFSAIGTKEQPACTTDADCDSTASSTCDTVTTHLCTPVYAYPTNIVITNNVVNVTGHASSFGVRAESYASITVDDNSFTGKGAAAAGYAGIYMRATQLGRDVGTAKIRRNRLIGWGQRGAAVQGNSTARVTSVEFIGNYCGNVAAGGPQTQCISLDDTLGELQSAIVRDNVAGCGTTTPIANLAKNTRFSGGRRAYAAACPP